MNLHETALVRSSDAELDVHIYHILFVKLDVVFFESLEIYQAVLWNVIELVKALHIQCVFLEHIVAQLSRIGTFPHQLINGVTNVLGNTLFLFRGVAEEKSVNNISHHKQENHLSR